MKGKNATPHYSSHDFEVKCKQMVSEDGDIREINNENGFSDELEIKRESSISQLGSVSVRNVVIAQQGKAVHKYVKLVKTPSTEYHRADTSFHVPTPPPAMNFNIFNGNDDGSPDVRSIAGDERSFPKSTARVFSQ